MRDALCEKGTAMRISQEEYEVLLSMQENDLAARALQREFDALPQRQALLDIRAKKRVLLQKTEQIAAVVAEAKTKNSRLHAEDELQEAKQARVQAEIEAVRSDFRSVESRTKELAGIAKRREALKEDMKASGEALAKAETLKKQADAAMAQLDQAEKAQTDEFVQRGTRLKAEMARHRARYERDADELSDELSKLYAKVLSRTQGVVLSELQNSTCSVCRAHINEGKVLDMYAQGNAALCPHCGRIVILEEF